MTAPIYDAKAHESWSGTEQWPHVTGVLRAVGISADFDGLPSYRRKALELAAARGTAVHADCHAYDDDDLIIEAVDARIRPYVDAWAECRASERLTPVAHARERYVYHPDLRYAGTLDGIWLRDGRRILGDLKTGDPENAAAHLQTAAYEGAWSALNPAQPIDERWAIWLRPGRVVPYTIINYTARADAWRDWETWAACLTVYREQSARRMRVSNVT